MSDVVKVARDGRVAVVSLNRPDKLNACSPAVFTGLANAGLEVQADDEVRAVVLRGEGRAFCAGLDTASLQAFGSGSVPDGNGDRPSQEVPAVDGFTIWHTMSKPVVAAVQGYALGAGFQLALAADIRFASPDVVMSVFEITYGLVPDLGGTQLLPRLIGPARAKELIWTAQRFSGEQAQAWGIVNHVVPLDELEDRARAFAHDLASRPPLPISFAKELVDVSGRISLDEGHQRELMAQMKCLQSADMREAVAAAFEKREGSYTGT
jgi:enoyl-CoA hydratase/carnithine racemase